MKATCCDLLLKYAWTFMGTPYVWGGKELSRDSGLDCSGFVQECLEAIGVVNRGMNNVMSAQMLFDRLFPHTNHQIVPQSGDLLFFGNSTSQITHIAIADTVGDNGQVWMIEAGGGASSTTRQGMVRISPLRKDIVAILALKPIIDKNVRL